MREPVPITVPKEPPAVGNVAAILPLAEAPVATFTPDPILYPNAAPVSPLVPIVKTPRVATGTLCPGRTA